MRNFPIAFLLLCLPILSFGQSKKALDHKDFAIWNQISRKLISNNGTWVAYEVQPGEGNPTLHLYNGISAETTTFDRGSRPQFTNNSQFAVFTLKADHESLLSMRKSGTKKKDLPGDTLAIYNLNTGAITKVAETSSHQVPAKWDDWVAYKQEMMIKKDSSAKPEKRTDLILHYLPNGNTFSLAAVGDFTLAKEAPIVLASSKGAEEVKAAGVYHFDASTRSWTTIHEQKGDYKQLALDKNGQQAAFLANFDTSKQSRVDYFELYLYNESQNLLKIADADAAFLPENWLISDNGQLSFSENTSRLFFGIAPEPVLQDTALLPEEIVNVEVWNYKDKTLYTRQEVQANREKRRTFQCVYDLASNRIIQLGSTELPEVRLGNEGNGPYALAYTETPYLERLSWEGGPTYKDVYLIDLKSGQRKSIAKELRGSPALSPEGKYVYWYSVQDTAWYAYATYNNKLVQLTNNDKVAFYNELNDSPNHPSTYGIAGWTKDDDFILIYDRYDVWYVDPSKNLAHNNLTNGRAQKRISRYVWLDRDERSIEEVSPMLMHYRDEATWEQGYYWFNIHTGTKNTVQSGDYAFTSRPLKAKNANSFVFTKETYQEFPDLQYGREGLDQAQKISEANPQQASYNWGSIEPYTWTSTDGQKLTGLLLKPEGFDPEKQYPMIVNFYERSSQGLHSYRTPTPHRSTINYPFYVSRGYLIFNPDIPYREGYPGESAYNAVLSGVTSLIDDGFVDKENIGLQGHSWGGYQIAHIITKTDMFKCVESGAPVVNMFSAYGGIRWASGMSRMFQYEHTQSRIGATIWDKPLRYIENSPIFFLDKINTPVLILHNDNDGAVPWYQGIEFFVGMRRLGKPAWMLNYNDEPHWPLKLQNRKDFQLRMSQFFDYYLKAAPMPRWMEEGVPAIEKGINQRLDLLDKH